MTTPTTQLQTDLEPIEDWERDCLMTVETFANSVKNGRFIDYDGFGELATETHKLGGEVIPSSFNLERAKAKGATHVVWYNR